MTDLLLPNGRRSTQIVFGCGGLGGGVGFRDSRRLLIAAWDAGIRHFDVAPSYGLGEAEAIVGKVAAELGPDVAITTKVGIGPARGHKGPLALLRPVARALLSRTPGLKGKLGKRIRATQVRGQFSPAFVRASVEDSLRALDRDHIDILLLHEAVAEDITPELLETLRDLQQEGKVGSCGAGSRLEKWPDLQARMQGMLQIAQMEWRAESPPPPVPDGCRRNFHGVMRSLPLLRHWMSENAPLRGELEEANRGREIDDATFVAAALGLALAETGGGQIVVQSGKADRIRHFSDPLRFSDPGKILTMTREAKP